MTAHSIEVIQNVVILYVDIYNNTFLLRTIPYISKNFVCLSKVLEFPSPSWAPWDSPLSLFPFGVTVLKNFTCFRKLSLASLLKFTLMDFFQVLFLFCNVLYFFFIALNKRRPSIILFPQIPATREPYY